MTDINLRILLSASQGNTMSVISGIERALGSKSSGGLQGALTAVGIAAAGMAVAIGIEAVNKASAFQNAMLQNVAHAGLAKNQFDAVSKSVLAMSTDVGQMPTDLAQGLYPILSGFSGITNESAKAQSSLAALRLAAEDVVGTETKTTVTSGALVSAFNALGLQTNNTATNISRLNTLNDQMEATVIAGNMHWDQYANVVGKLATAIKGTNVQWTEASAALATMTNEGFTAQRSQTYLANLFTQLDLKTDSLNKNAKKLNITFDEQKFKTMSLMDQLNYLKDITGGNASEVLKLLNNNATALKTYDALQGRLDIYKTSLDSIKNSQGATTTAFDTSSSSFKAATDRFKAAIDVFLINLGTGLLPVLTNLVNWLTPLVKQFSNFVDWMSKGSAAAKAVGDMLKVVGLILTTMKVTSWAQSFITALTNIATQSGTTQAVIASDAAKEEASLASVGTTAKGASLGISGIASAALSAVSAVGALAFAMGGIAVWLHDSGIVPDVNKITGGHDTNPGWITHKRPPGMASGVTNFSGGLAYVHQGEVLSNLAPGTNVTPASHVSLGGGPNITINVSTMAGSRAEITRMVDLLEREMAARFRGQTAYGFGGVV